MTQLGDVAPKAPEADERLEAPPAEDVVRAVVVGLVDDLLLVRLFLLRIKVLLIKN